VRSPSLKLSSPAPTRDKCVSRRRILWSIDRSGEPPSAFRSRRRSKSFGPGDGRYSETAPALSLILSVLIFLPFALALALSLILSVLILSAIFLALELSLALSLILSPFAFVLAPALPREALTVIV